MTRSMPGRVHLEQAEGAAGVGGGAGDGAVGAVEAFEVEGVAGQFGAASEPGGLGLDGPVEPPGGDRGPLDEDGAGVGGGPPVVVPGLELGLEPGGVLAGEDGVHGAEAVGHAVELGDVLALGGGGAPGLLAVLTAGLSLLLGTLHRRCPFVGWGGRDVVRGSRTPTIAIWGEIVLREGSFSPEVEAGRSSPPPLWGRVRVGGSSGWPRPPTPHPNPPPQGGREKRGASGPGDSGRGGPDGEPPESRRNRANGPGGKRRGRRSSRRPLPNRSIGPRLSGRSR